jgi:hypothetical protein
MPIRKAGRWVVTVSLDHEALEVYQGFTKGQKSAKVCSALILYNVNQKKNRNESARQKLLDRAMLRLKKDLKVANYRIESIQRGDNDPGSGPAVYLEVLAAEAKEENRSLRGGRF